MAMWPGGGKDQFEADACRLNELCKVGRDKKEKGLSKWPKGKDFKPVQTLRDFFCVLFGASQRAERGKRLFKDGAKGKGWNAKTVGAGPGFGRVMKQHMFKMIQANLHKLWEHEDDDWKISKLFSAFNSHMSKLVETGQYIVVDEFMCAWRPRSDKLGRLPHISFIKRKPEPLGSEFKDLCDEHGIMLTAELQESKDAMADKPHRDQLHMAGGACASRLVEDAGQAHKNKILIGDAGFGSVPAAVYLLSKLGTYATLNVKGAHGGFPDEWLRNAVKGHGAGTCVAMEAEVEHNGRVVKLMALSYRYSRSKKAQLFVSTCGSTAAGEFYTAKFKDAAGQPCAKPVWRPKVLNAYWAYSNKIDTFNHVRQSLIALEKAWKTKDAHFRLMTTVFGNCLTQGYFVRRAAGGGTISVNAYVSAVANDLGNWPDSDASSSDDDSSESDDDMSIEHMPAIHYTNNNAPGYKDCVVCSRLFGESRAVKTVCQACGCQAICRMRKCWDHHVRIGHLPPATSKDLKGDKQWHKLKRRGDDAMDLDLRKKKK